MLGRENGVILPLVTFEEALRELGIDRGASPDQARRAYLRLLKQRKPETDPEGFRRLRGAFELLRAAFVRRDAAADAAAGSQEKDLAPVADEPLPQAATRAETTIVARSAEPPAEDVVAAPLPVERPPVLADPDLARLEEIRRLVKKKKSEAAARLLAEHYEAAMVRPGLLVPPPPATVDLLLLRA